MIILHNYELLSIYTTELYINNFSTTLFKTYKGLYKVSLKPVRNFLLTRLIALHFSYKNFNNDIQATV